MPLLDNRPDMQRSVQQKIDRAQSARSIEEKAFALREALDEIRATLHKDQPRAASTERSLWDRLGGQLAVKAVVHDFVAAAATDPKVNFMRGKPLPDAEGIAKLEDKVVEFISSATGGPLKYTGKDMVAAHTGMNITNEEFDALAGHLVATLKKFNVPEKETNELMTIVGSTRRDIVGW
jgi:hemoglobin